jgi:NAD(P)-dependent dehydrogenase (short-subunit alcohol dehydrogenase family)
LDEIILPPLHMMHAVLPVMRAQRSGSIITVASDAAKSATPGEALIGAAMAAIVMFSRTAAIEAKRDGIRINLLTPSLAGPQSRRITGQAISVNGGISVG